MKQHRTLLATAFLLAPICLLLTVTAGCSAPFHMRSFAHSEADYEFYQRVGIIPFRSETDDHLAGAKVSEPFLTEMLINGHLEIMDPGQFNAVLSATLGPPNPSVVVEYSPDDLKRLGEAGQVQGIFMGIVHDYRMMQVAGERYPVLSMTVKFIDAPTGTVVWQNNVTSRGGPNYPIISAGESFVLGELTQKVCKKVARDFYKKTGLQ